MKKEYARIEDSRLVRPTDVEFNGIPNYMSNDAALRKREYMPLVGEPEEREGFEAVPSTWHVVEAHSVRNEMRQVDGGDELVMTPVDVDESYIQVDSWDYVEIPAEPQTDETEFMHACVMFRNVCAEIGEFIGDDEFRGGFDDYGRFIGSSAAERSKASASLLASMWNGANEYAKYEGSKLGYGQPAWWYRCWEYSDEELAEAESRRNGGE